MTESSGDQIIPIPAPTTSLARKLNVPLSLDMLKPINENRSGWALNLFQEAGEASGSFRASSRPFQGSSEEKSPEREAWDKERSREEASRRARGMIRRYCAHNRLNRLGRLTFEGEGCHNIRQLRIYLCAFFVELRKAIGRDLPHGSQDRDQARIATGYLAKYVGKGFLDE